MKHENHMITKTLKIHMAPIVLMKMKS